MSAAAPPAPSVDELELQTVLAAIADGAPDRDRALEPVFPEAALRLLGDAGLLAWNALPGPERPCAATELGLVRRVAAADASVGRIFDGHLNAVERLATQAPAAVRDRDLAAVRAGELRAGVWGGDPVPGEGEPARVAAGSSGEAVLRGVKTFCSGAGGLERALVLARDADPGPPVTVWIDLTDERHVGIDPTWYRASGLRASVSHRVVFHDAPVLAQFGPPGAIAALPWFARDALRTCASWAGMADAALAAALGELRARPRRGELEALAAGRMRAAHATIDVWLREAAAAMDDGEPGRLADVSLHARAAVADSARVLLDEAARACGSRPFARGDALDRARRDLQLFVLQHRLDPMLARAGARELEERG